MKFIVLLALFSFGSAARAAAESLALRNAAIITAVGGLTIGYEKWVSDSMPDRPSSGMRRISNGIAGLGDGAYDGAFIAASYAAGALAGDKKLSRTAVLAGESFLMANAAGTVLKSAAGRSRPYTGRSNLSFRLFSFKDHNTSFPSGHTINAFSVASVFASRYDSGAVPAVAYSLASLVAAQRVYARKHWLSDVALGAFIGTCAGKLVVKWEAGKKKDSVWLLPDLAGEGGYAGLRAVYVF